MLISVVVPTVTGREPDLARLLQSLAFEPYDTEIMVLRNRPTCGEAWVEGARLAHGQYIWFAADDVEPQDGFFAPMIEAARVGSCPTALVFEPNGTLQSAGISGWDCHKPDDPSDWDVVEHTTTPFISRGQWNMIEPEAHFLEDLHYCSDMFVSHVLGEHGIPTVVRTEARLSHFNSPVRRGADTGDQHTRTAQDRAKFEAWRNERSPQ